MGITKKWFQGTPEIKAVRRRVMLKFEMLEEMGFMKYLGNGGIFDNKAFHTVGFMM